MSVRYTRDGTTPSYECNQVHIPWPKENRPVE
jgi:hypothetical protein